MPGHTQKLHICPNFNRLGQISPKPGTGGIDFKDTYSAASDLKKQLDDAGISPEQGYAILTRELAVMDARCPDKSMHIRITAEDNLKICGYFNQDVAFEDTRSYDPSQKEVTTGVIRVMDNAQGQGLGRRLLRNQIEFFALLGYKSMEILASNDNGAYSWARFGFKPVPDKQDEEELEKLAARVDCLEKTGVIEESDAEELRLILESGTEEIIPCIAGLQMDVCDKIGLVFEDFDYDFMKVSGFTDDLDQPQTLWEGFMKSWENNERLPLGRVLLSGLSWIGKLDFNDSAQMKHVHDYSGGFHYLNFVDNNLTADELTANEAACSYVNDAPA
mgnify:CR=1 FL=1